MPHHRSRYYLPGPVATARLPPDLKDADIVRTRRLVVALLGALALLCLACPAAAWFALKGMF